MGTGAARHNIPNIGLYLWRVRAFPLTRSPAVADPAIGGGLRFRFNPLGIDMALYNTPETEEEISHLAEPRNVPMPLARRWLKAHLDDYYGLGKSLWLELDGNPPQLIARNNIRICDLSDIKDGGGNVIAWAHQPAAGSGLVSIDPVLGRIAFADAPASTPLVSFHYGFTIAIGGGEYERGEPAVPVTPVQTVQGGAALQPALNLVQNGGTVEVLDSRRYVETPAITVNAGKTVVLRAVNGARPLLAASGDIALKLGAEATLILDGWVISGGTLKMAAFADTQPRYLVLRDCTLVPGPRQRRSAAASRCPRPGGKSCLRQDRAGTLHYRAAAYRRRCRSLVKRMHRGCDRAKISSPSVAPAPMHSQPGGALTLESCTVIGKVHTRQLTLASDCIFVAALTTGGDTWKAPLWAERRQQGCVRFSYMPPGSRTPSRYHCQPEDSDQQTWPQFTSLHYGDPGYCQLLQSTSDKIRRGAHDESEMGVLHGLYQPQRETNLRVRLEEYLRFGLEAGLIYGS